MISTEMYRQQQRAKMVYHTRRNIRGEPLCHCCGVRPGSQMHELVNRAQTNGNDLALRLSFTETLCSWLCPTCHGFAPDAGVEYELWKRNFQVYGREEVLTDFRLLTEALGFTPIVNMPEE